MLKNGYIIDTLREAGYKLTLHDIGNDEAVMVIAVKADPADLWYLGRECMEKNLEMGAPFYTGNGIVYFPSLVADSYDFDRIMA